MLTAVFANFHGLINMTGTQAFPYQSTACLAEIFHQSFLKTPSCYVRNVQLFRDGMTSKLRPFSSICMALDNFFSSKKPSPEVHLGAMQEGFCFHRALVSAAATIVDLPSFKETDLFAATVYTDRACRPSDLRQPLIAGGHSWVQVSSTFLRQAKK
jgi:hypothetical protein